MKKRLLTFTGCFLLSLVLIWGGLLATDAYRCFHLQKPLFAVGTQTADDGGSGIYQGLGYTVKLDGSLSDQYGYVVQSAELTAFGKVIAAAIT